MLSKTSAFFIAGFASLSLAFSAPFNDFSENTAPVESAVQTFDDSGWQSDDSGWQ